MELYQFLEDNLKAMELRGDKALPWLANHREELLSLKEEIFFNRWGVMDLPAPGGRGIFEAMPPAAYYREWLRMEKPETCATFIVGVNLGYGLNHVLENTPDSHKVVVLEPDPRRLAACLGQTDYRPFFELNKLFFLPPEKSLLRDVVQRLDLQLLFGTVHLRSDTPSKQFGPEYALWTRIVREHLEDFSVEMSTLRRRQDEMVGNELGNYVRAFNDGSVTPLEGAGRGMAAVILGAGPSLADFGPHLAQKPGRALYATALQTLPALQNIGLKPDMCMAIDYSRGMLNIFKRLDPDFCREVPLFYSTKILPEVLRQYPGPTLPVWTIGGLATKVLAGRQYVLDAGGNVSVSLMRLLSWFGASSFLLVGQDFSWKADRSHAEGHHAAIKREFDPKRHLRMKNLDGEEVVSTMPYVTSLRDMERDLAKLEVPAANLYGGGLDIKGAAPVDLEQAFTRGFLASAPGSLESFTRAMAAAMNPVPRPVFEQRSGVWSSSMRQAGKRLEKLFKKPEKNQLEIHNTLEAVCTFLRQDPLYAPYLYNEIMDMSGLSRARVRHSRADLPEFNRISKRVLAKVREIDRVLGAGNQDENNKRDVEAA